MKILDLFRSKPILKLDDKDYLDADPVQQFMKMDISHFNWLKNYDFRTVLDIGANRGQFAYRMRSLFPEIMIYSFEPLQEAFDQLMEHFKNDPLFRGFQYALGETETQQEMFMNEFSLSSSLLRLGDEHKKHFQFATRETPVKIRVTTLDKICAELDLAALILIKIDVQGFEEKVIAGGSTTLKKCSLIIIEVSFRELYEGQPPFHSVYTKLTDLGFKYAGNFEQLLSPVDGEILQADALFINHNLASAPAISL